MDIADSSSLASIFEQARPEAVLHLAAQAGVRYSLENPGSYVQANLVGFANLLECCRRHPPRHLVFASSSSVYGSNPELPWSESQNVDHPVSLYAATKKSNELMAHVYNHLFGLKATGLRYFTVYGPWGRPDMSVMIFARAIMEGRPIPVFNHGDMKRDFTFIDDIVTGVVAALDHPPPNGRAGAPHRLYNIGNHKSEPLMRLIEVLERALNRKATIDFQPMQPGDVKETYADITAIHRDLGYSPTTPIDVGVPKFVQWFREYHGV
jgi:UDP-glucuronate 4-epimerase